MSTPVNPSCDLDALLDAIKAAIAAQFPKLKTVDDYLRLDVEEPLKTPAVAVQIDGIEEDGDSGTGQLDGEISLTAYCIVSYRTVNGVKAKRRAVSLAAALAAFVKTQTWGQPVGVAKDISAAPAFWQKKDRDGKAEEYECYAVEWRHTARFGADIWDEETPSPAKQVFIGIAPKIGTGHEDDYFLAGGDTPETAAPQNPATP